MATEIDKIDTSIEITGSNVSGSDIYRKLASLVGKERVTESNLDRILYSHDLAPLPKELGV